MSGFNLFAGNRLEILAERLAERIHSPLSDPLQREIVVVQSSGMQRWVSMQIAAHKGVCANIAFPFPRAFLYQIASSVADVSAGDEYEPEFLAWRISGLLPDCLGEPVYGDIRNYLTDDRNGLKLYQLSAKIAHTFDRYLVYRPEMIAAWEKGDRGNAEEIWQADLWRKIRGSVATEHIVGIYRLIVERLHNSALTPRLPERIAVFGISSLPPLYLHLFRELSRFTEVNGFFLNPSREFWMDIRSDREIVKTLERVRERSSLKDATPEDLYLQEGNSLLSSFGRTGRDFFAQLLEFSASVYEEFSDPDERSLLGVVQSDILNLKDRDGGGNPEKIVPSDDASIRIHACHSMLREIEVLYDQLLEMFAGNPDLLPKDVVVMAPDISTYAPYIEAVFGVHALTSDPQERSRQIHYTIADEPIERGSSIFQAMTAVLELLEGRFVLSQFLSLLDHTPIRRRFGLDEDDAEAIRRWVVESGIRWGIDAEDRRSRGLPATMENTWRMGLDRMLLGYAIPDEGRRIFAGIVPYGDIEGKDSELLGRFVALVEEIISLGKSLSEPRTLKEWASYFLSIAGELLEPSAEQDEPQDFRLLLQKLEEMSTIEEKGAFSGTVEFFVVKSLLEKSLKETKRSYGYISGGVTFCSLLPMRSIPHRVVCVIGMNNADYPRRPEEVAFDLIRINPSQGDPSPMDEDRYLFLESLLSARQFFSISYVGLSGNDNSPIPPSVVVSELLDYLAEGFSAAEGTLREQLLTSHRLQAFHPSYFQPDKKPFSYCRHNCRAAKRLSDPSRLKRVFFSDPLPDEEDVSRNISTADLKSFFGNPSKYLLKKRIGLSFEGAYEIPPDSEAFRIYGLPGYEIGEEMLKYALTLQDGKEFFHLLVASGKLPHGVAGLAGYQALWSEISAFAVLLKKESDGKTMKPVDLDLSLGGFHIAGRVHDVSKPGILRYRFARIRAKDHLGIWLDMLLLGAAGEGTEAPSFIIGRNERWKYLPPQNAADTLSVLLELYAQGMRNPLFFFPETSLCYVERLMKGSSEKEALRQAEKKWHGDSYANGVNGEADDPYFRQCFSQQPDFDDAFRKTASAVFTPLLLCRDKHK